MLEVNEKTLEKFADNFLNNMLFGDLPTDQLEDLKTFLVDYLKKLYQDKPNDIIKLIEQAETIYPFMIKLTLGFGILEEDIADLTKILFMKINEFFYKKGSFEALKHISKILEYYGITSYIKKVIYDKQTDSWVLEDVFDGTRETTDIEEFITPGHLVTKENYALNTFTDGYDTVVIYIKLELTAKVDDRMQRPVALLHAYAITKHKNNILQFYVNGNVYNLTFKEFLFFLQYFYLKYIKIKNPDFELDESGLEMWSLFITDPDDMELAAELLQSLLAGEFNNRDGIAYFLRISSRLLNKYKRNTNPYTLDEISEQAYSINEQLTSNIDSLNNAEEFIENLGMTMLYVNAYLGKLPVTTQLDEAVKDTIRYLITFVVFSMNTDYTVKSSKNLILKFKRYFLPIYTQFFFEIIKTFKIKNKYFRIYIEDFFKQFLRVRNSGLIETQDKQDLEIGTAQHIANKISDLAATRILSSPEDILNINDKPITFLDIGKNSLLELRDLQFMDISMAHQDYNEVTDSAAVSLITISKNILKFNDKQAILLNSKEINYLNLQDLPFTDISMARQDYNEVTDSAVTIPISSPKEMLTSNDEWALNLYLSFESIIDLNDSNSSTVIQYQADHTDIIDSVTITII